MNRFQQRRIGRTDLQVSVLGLGGAPLGDLYERIPPDRALATLETAYRRGIRLFDTAPLYGHGLSEHRFGHVLRDKPRAEFVISTKVGRWLRPERSDRVRSWSIRRRAQFPNGLRLQLRWHNARIGAELSAAWHGSDRHTTSGVARHQNQKFT